MASQCSGNKCKQEIQLCPRSGKNLHTQLLYISLKGFAFLFIITYLHSMQKELLRFVISVQFTCFIFKTC
jgi:hypothetical protein